MTLGEELLESIHYQIIGMRCIVATYARISELLDVNVNTAQKVFYRWKETESGSSAQRSGAPKKLNESDLRLIKRHIQHDRMQCRQPLGEIILDLNLSVCEKTLETAIVKEIGMGHRIERKTPWLSSDHKAA